MVVFYNCSMLEVIALIRELGELRRCLAAPIAVDPRDRWDILEEIADLEARLEVVRQAEPEWPRRLELQVQR